jgi:hypothetical protein
MRFLLLPIILVWTSLAFAAAPIYQVGLILPLKGKNSSMGQRALKAVTLSLPQNRLVIIDSQDDPAKAALAVDKLAQQSNVIAILGGINGKESAAISVQAEKHGIAFFSFSQKLDITDNKLFTFRNAITAQMQMLKLLQHSFTHLKAKKFAIMYPNDSYGIEYANQFWDLVLAGGGEVVAATTYHPQEKNFNEPVQKLLGMYHSKARWEEFKVRRRVVNKHYKKLQDMSGQRENIAQEDILTPIVDFDVLFVPDTAKNMTVISAFIRSKGVPSINYLGTNLWSRADIFNRIEKSADHIYFVDTAETKEFSQQFKRIYRYSPAPLEIQIFETSEIFKSILSKPKKYTRSLLAYELTNLNTTINGSNLKMSNNNEMERDLEIFTLNARGKITKATDHLSKIKK